MAKNKDILGVLTKRQLLEISNFLGYRSWQVLSKGEIIQSISRQRTTSMQEILCLLKINELRYICMQLDLNPGGLGKQTLIDRILGKESSSNEFEQYR
jgi:hypothetical protein